MEQSVAGRERRVIQAVANERLEGLVVSDESRRIADRYIVGEVSAAKAADMIRKRYGIHVS
ncbi:MAG: antitoxin VbhA family protein [Propionibacteriaceae bacterium]|nr:antitoxin VbhA family protein [Propionibacteriaceae bacterium]